VTRVIGLTGGIGAGKSTVAQILEEFGAKIIDGDKIGHESYLPGTKTWQDLVTAYGKQIVAADGSIDRKKLGATVFGNPEQLNRLNRIVHPRMAEMIKERIAQYRNGGAAMVVLEAAILFEANWAPLVDEVWVVVAGEPNVVQRVSARSGISEEQIRARILSQMSTAKRIRKSNIVIQNVGSIEHLKLRVRELWDTAIK
jgi:dephospho-CoA kinase